MDTTEIDTYTVNFVRIRHYHDGSAFIIVGLFFWKVSVIWKNYKFSRLFSTIYNNWVNCRCYVGWMCNGKWGIIDMIYCCWLLPSINCTFKHYLCAGRLGAFICWRRYFQWKWQHNFISLSIYGAHHPISGYKMDICRECSMQYCDYN